MALAYTDIQIEIREISLKDRPQELYHISPKGTVPVLVIDDKTIIEESLDIITWSLKTKDNQTWLGKNPSKEMSLITTNDTTFKKWLDRYKYHDKYPENSKESYRDKCDIILSEYENKLGNTQYLLRNETSIADIAIFPFIRQFSNVDYKWFEDNYTYLKKWLEDISSSNLFISVMYKYDTWDSTNQPQIVNFNN